MRLGLLFVVVVAACSGPAKPPAVTEPAPPSVQPEVKPPAPPVPAMEVAVLPTGQDFLEGCHGNLAKAKDQQKAIVELTGARSVANTLEGFNELLRYASNALASAGLFSQVHPDPKVRDAARICEREVAAYMADLWLDKRLYDAIKAVDVKQSDADTRRFATLLLRDYKRAGVTLDDKSRARAKELEDKIVEVGQEISKTIAEDTRYIEVTDKAKLAGLPADWIDAHKPDAKGVIKISTDYPDYIPFISYAADDDLRKQLYIKFRSRGDATNEAAIGKLLELRAEKAKLLGFKDWADYQSDDKMLRGGKQAQQFIDRVTNLARNRARKDYNELLEQLKKHDPKATAVTDWQKAWLEIQVKKEKYSVDTAAVRDYFSYDKTLAGLLDITSAIYDITYKPVTDPRTWHPDVRVYDVMRKDAKLGRIFLDMHPRADKYKHAAMFPYVPGVAGKQLPEGTLVCNFANPKTSNPALIEHADVVTMFHEFGHLMHHVLGGQQKWITQSGVATEQDFVEAPSQMFEEWGWSYETLSKFAKHYKTGEPIPKDLVERMNKSRKFGVGTYAVQQMLYAALSLQLHQGNPKQDQLALVKKLQTKYTPFAYVEGTRFHTSFGHLVEYSSMYYTYMWSLVIAKDLLTPFQKTGLLDTATTYRYRDKILAGGGTKNAADLVADFLGRKYDFKAYERFLSE
ncbi:MAG: M3 family metallopeptidase [Kofleriaceae bacterium]